MRFAARGQHIDLCRQVAQLMLGCVERGGRLHIVCSKILRGVMFMNCVATEGAAKCHDSGINSKALVSRRLWQGSEFHHNASREDECIVSF